MLDNFLRPFWLMLINNGMYSTGGAIFSLVFGIVGAVVVMAIVVRCGHEEVEVNMISDLGGVGYIDFMKQEKGRGGLKIGNY